MAGTKSKSQSQAICHSKLESAFQQEVLDFLTKEVGGYWLKICASSYQKQGEPDIIGCYNGKFYGLELKRDINARASALQIYKLEKIKQNGGISMKVYSLQQLKELFNIVSE